MFKALFILSSLMTPPVFLSRRSILQTSMILPQYNLDGDSDSSDSSDRSFIKKIHNNIYYTGPLTDESVFAITAHLVNLQNTEGIDHINLHIQSQGGSLLPTLGLVDHIRVSDIPVNTYVKGYAASAASLVSVVGAKRFINKHGLMLVHQLKMGLEPSKYQELQDQYENSETLMSIIREIYLENTNISPEKLDYLLKHDYWLNSTTCKEYGFIDIVM